MAKSNKRKRLTNLLAVLALCVAGGRIYFEIVPRGASMIPFLVASVDGGGIESPDGAQYHVWFNDAGAAHSGNHWTWIVGSNPIFGKHVVTQGFLGAEQAIDGEPLPLTWEDDHPVVQFRNGRYDR